jgi:pimeloyl-ACP methyl ester carboxylesterase
LSIACLLQIQFVDHRTIVDPIGSHLSLNLKIRGDRIQNITYAIQSNPARAGVDFNERCLRLAREGRSKYDINLNKKIQRGTSMTTAAPNFPAHDLDLGADMKIRYFHRAGGDTRLVLLHPSSGYGRMWELTADHLDRRFSVYAPDQRGHGDSGRPNGEYSAEEYAHELRSIVDQWGLKRIVVGGHSLGGRVALIFAARYPEITAGLIMVAGPHLSNFYQTRAAVQSVYTSAYKMLVSPAEFASRADALAFIRQLRPQDAEFAIQHRLDHNMDHAADGRVTVKYDPVRVAQGLTHQLVDLKKYAADVRCPTAFIRATASTEMTPDAARDVAKFWQQTEVDIYSVEAKTSLQLENPGDLAAAISSFADKRL